MHVLGAPTGLKGFYRETSPLGLAALRRLLQTLLENTAWISRPVHQPRSERRDDMFEKFLGIGTVFWPKRQAFSAKGVLLQDPAPGMLALLDTM